MPVIVAIGAILYYRNNLSFDYNFRINKKELRSQLKIGIPLTINSLSFGSYVYLERILIMTYLSMTDLGYYGFATMISNQLLTIFLSAISVRKMNILEYLGNEEYKRVNKIVFKETAILLLGSIVLIPIIWIILNLLIPLILKDYTAAIVTANIFLIVIPLKVIGSYIAIVLISPIVNKQNIMPYYQFAATGFLAIITFIMYKMNVLSLKTFIIADLLGYAFVHFSLVFLYYKHFYLKFCRK